MSEDSPARRARRAGALAREGSVAGVLYRREAAQRVLDAVLSPEAKAAQTRGAPGRVSDEPGFVLHTHPWSESSLLADVLTVRYGRVFLVAKGAKRPSSNLRGLLTPFSPVKLAWSGRREAKILTRAEWMGTMTPLSGEAIMSGFYLNELILKLTEREDPHPGLFELYARTLNDLGFAERKDRSAVLRRFEKRFLELLGWAVSLEGAIDPAGHYLVHRGEIRSEGTVPAEERNPKGGLYPAELVAALLSDDFSSAAKLRGARDILRELIQFRLGDRVVHSRRVLGELSRL